MVRSAATNAANTEDHPRRVRTARFHVATRRLAPLPPGSDTSALQVQALQIGVSARLAGHASVRADAQGFKLVHARP